MPIVKMKRLLLAAPLKDKERLLSLLQRLGCVEVTGFDVPSGDLAGLLHPQETPKTAAQTDQDLARLRWAIDKLGKYAKQKTSMFSPKPAASQEALMITPQAEQAQEALLQELEALEHQLGDLRGQEARIMSGLETLIPWLKLDLPMEEIRDSATFKQYLGTLPKAELAPLQQAWAGEAVAIEDLGLSRENAALWAVAHTAAAPRFSEALKQAGFVQASFPVASGTAQAQYERLQRAQGELARLRDEAEARLSGLAAELSGLKLYFDAVSARRARLSADDKLLHTRESFLLRGWLPEPIQGQVQAVLARDFPDAVAQVTEPDAQDEPPVLLHNNPVVAPFESVVTGFAMPSAKGIDPSAVMMPFFACFLGMMVSDAGYGLMMALLVPLLIKVMKPSQAGRKLFWVIGIGGLFTVFWGFIYNTWFGYNPMANPIMDPINRPMEVMILCIALGAVHLLAGLGLAAWLHIRRGEYLDVLYDQISWIMILAGLGMLAVPSLAGIGQYVALAGVVIILLFAGRNKTKNPIKRVLSGLGTLYGVTSWVSDLLSYVRLFGMGLATGVIGLVINQLVAMVFAAGPIGWVLGAVIFVAAHVFNAGINILGAYVHSCRLQYIEFFGKFYEEGGKPFKPLEQAPRYVRISDA
ncbi:MAG: V-type ATP synthase subunit I [Christensenellales bacterium]